MFVIDGIVYGGEPEEQIKIKEIKILDDGIMILTFSTGETRLFDSTVLHGGVFDQLRDDVIFKSAEIDHGVVTWANGAIDCAPEFMYKNSYEYSCKTAS